ncbi:hypothetical protein [Nostoc sp. CALU 1950]|uniref:hypothetical protein n=1 Tax=Nostoc sp. CALU 1950 TaxID=3104321 RepID=UPI003EBA43BD
MQTLTGGDCPYQPLYQKCVEALLLVARHRLYKSMNIKGVIAKFKNCPVELALSQWLHTLKLKQHTFRRLAQ